MARLRNLVMKTQTDDFPVSKGQLTKAQHLNFKTWLAAGLAFFFTLANTPATTKSWSGSGGDNFWSTAANWTNNLAPVAGDDLLFPGVTLRLSNSNNLAANTAISSITFSGSNYVIAGNSILLNAGMTNSSVAPRTNSFN